MIRVLLAAALLFGTGCVPYVARGPYGNVPQLYQGIPSRTPVPLVVTSAISSRGPFTGNVVYVSVAQDVIVGGELRIRSGTPVQATIVRSPSAGAGRPGSVEVRPTAVPDVNGLFVALRAGEIVRYGRRRTGSAVGLSIGLMPFLGPFSWFFLARNGNDVTIAPGTTLLATAM